MDTQDILDSNMPEAAKIARMLALIVDQLDNIDNRLIDIYNKMGELK